MVTIQISRETMDKLFERVSKIRMENHKAGVYKVVSYDSVIYDLLNEGDDE